MANPIHHRPDYCLDQGHKLPPESGMARAGAPKVHPPVPFAHGTPQHQIDDNLARRVDGEVVYSGSGVPAPKNPDPLTLHGAHEGARNGRFSSTTAEHREMAQAVLADADPRKPGFRGKM